MLQRIRERRSQALSDKLDRLEEALLGINHGMWPNIWNSIWKDFVVLYRRRARINRKLGGS